MQTGQLIGGKYRLVTLVGEGGMGAVWHAMHMQLGHDVAVKFLHQLGANSEVLVNRFFDEARTAASVRHRNVIDILDFGIADDGRPYMVMEFMEGESLAARLERGPALTLPEVTLTVALSLGGLAAVHDRGIIHRDLKPDNIFLTYDADGSFPKILDFGVSKDMGRDTVGERSVQTRDGVLLGTPQYMSPEQARGLKDIDHRTDVYSMGVILYEVLAGVRPFESENVGDLLMMVISAEPKPLTELRPDLPPALSDVVTRAMSKAREDRFPDARAMRIALLGATNTARPSMVSSPDGSLAQSAEYALVALASEQVRLSVPTPMPMTAPTKPVTGEQSTETAPTLALKKPEAMPSVDISMRFDLPPEKPAKGETSKRVPLSSFPPPPKKGGGVGWFFALLLLALATTALGLELGYEGGLRGAWQVASAAIDERLGQQSGTEEATPDADDEDPGTAGALADDHETIRVRLRQVPDDATLTVDGQVFTPRMLPAMRSGEDRVITVRVRKRAEPFDIRVEAPGFSPFTGRRWAMNDVSYRLSLDPLPPQPVQDAGAPGGDTSVETTSPGTQATSMRRRPRPRRR